MRTDEELAKVKRDTHSTGFVKGLMLLGYADGGGEVPLELTLGEVLSNAYRYDATAEAEGEAAANRETYEAGRALSGRKLAERLKPHVSWSFRSTDEAYDRERVAREAAEAGIELLEINRPLYHAIKCTEGYIDRLIAVGMLPRKDFNSYSTSDAPIANAHRKTPLGKYTVTLTLRCSPAELHQKLETAERATVRTTVKGWK